MYNRILVPVDGSHTSTLGLQEAVRIALDQKASLRLLNVLDETIVTQNFEGLLNPGELIDAVHAAGKKALGNAAALVRKQGLRPEVATIETVGERVADIIVREAKKWRADLIVMGTHGRRGFNRLVLGSDAEVVLRNSPVPVLMVRSHAVKGRRRK